MRGPQRLQAVGKGLRVAGQARRGGDILCRGRLPCSRPGRVWFSEELERRGDRHTLHRSLGADGQTSRPHESLSRPSALGHAQLGLLLTWESMISINKTIWSNPQMLQVRRALGLREGGCFLRFAVQDWHTYPSWLPNLSSSPSFMEKGSPQDLSLRSWGQNGPLPNSDHMSLFICLSYCSCFPFPLHSLQAHPAKNSLKASI